MKTNTSEKVRSILNPSYSRKRTFSNMSIAKVISLTLVIFIISSCGIHIEKRRYTKGFNITLNKRLKSSTEETTEIKTTDLAYDNSLLEYEPTTLTTKDSHEEITPITKEMASSKVNTNHHISREEKLTKAPSFPHKKEIMNDRRTYTKNTKITGKKTKSPSNGDAQMLLIAGIVGVSSAALINKKRKSTLRHTRWANKNKYKSRSLIVLGQLGLGYVGYSIGGYFKEMGYEMSETSTYLVSGLSAATFLGMYVKEGTKRNMWDLKAFFREKSGHVILSACLLASSMGIGNGVSSNILQQGTMGQFVESIHTYDSEKTLSIQANERMNSAQDSIEKTTPYDQNELVGVIVLYVLLALILTVELAVLSCAAICSYGQIGILAVVGSIFVLAAFNIGMNLWIRNIKRK